MSRLKHILSQVFPPSSNSPIATTREGKMGSPRRWGIRFLLMAICFGGIFASKSLAASGVVIYKNTDQSGDATARGLAFVKMEQFPQVTNFTIGTGETFRILNQRIAGIVSTPDLSRATLVDEAGFTSLRTKMGEIAAMQQRFPKARADLEPLRAEYDRALQMIASGNVLSAGRWMSRENYQREAAAGQGKKVDLVVDGKQLTGAQVRSRNGGSVVIAHSGGVASIPIEKLSDEQIRLLNSTSMTVVIDRTAVPQPPAMSTATVPVPTPAATTTTIPPSPNPVSIGMVTPAPPPPVDAPQSPMMPPIIRHFPVGNDADDRPTEPQRVPIDRTREPVAGVIDDLKLWNPTEKESFEMRPLGLFRLELAHHKAMGLLGDLKGEAHERMLEAIRQQALIKLEMESKERAADMLVTIPTHSQVPASEKPQRVQPITSATELDVPLGALPPEYAAFVRLIADPWTSQAEDAVNLVEMMPPSTWIKPVQDLEAVGHPLVAKTVEDLKRSIDAVELTEAQHAQFMEGTYNNIWETADTAANGGFATTDAQGRMLRDDGATAVMGSILEAGFFSIASAIGRTMVGTPEDRFTQARLDAMGALFGELPKIYPPTPPAPGLITPEITQESIALVNTSGRDLTQVTIKLVSVHFISAPYDFGMRQVFVPRLAKGEKIHLKPEMRRLFREEGWKEREARPGSASIVHNPEEAWAYGAGGTVSAKVTAYALEGHEIERVVTFPENAVRTAKCELDDALRTLGTPGNQSGDHQWAINTARRVISMIPPGHPLGAEAAFLINSPAAAAEKGKAMVTEAILKRIVGTYKGSYEMTWGIQPVQGHKIPPGQLDAQITEIGTSVSDGQQKIDSAIQLDITGFTPEGYLGGVLSSPNDPKLQRRVIAKAPVKEEMDFTLEFIPAPGEPASLSLVDSHLTQCFTRLFLVFADGQLNNPSAIAGAGQFEVECDMTLSKEVPEE